MEQDFAKRRIRTPLAEPSPPPRSSGLALLLTGLVTGVVIGLFLGLLIYMSGMLPPAPGQQMADATQRDSEFLTQDGATVAEDGLTAEQEREAARLQLEFYQELPNYEVVVDVTPLPVPASQRSTPDPTTEPPAESSNAPATAESTTATVVAHPVCPTVPSSCRLEPSSSRELPVPNSTGCWRSAWTLVSARRTCPTAHSTWYRPGPMTPASRCCRPKAHCAAIISIPCA